MAKKKRQKPKPVSSKETTSPPGTESIDEREQADAALRESEERYKRLVDNAPDIIYRFRMIPEPVFEFISPTVTSITGYAPDDFYQNPTLGLQIIHPDDQKGLEDFLTGQIAERPHIVRWIHKNGDIIWMEDRQTPFFEDGELVGVEGIARDITERKQDEQTIQESEARYRSLFEASPISLWEEDFSAIKKYVDDLREKGVSDFRAHFDEHPKDVAHCAQMAVIIDVNDATLEMYKAKSKEALLGKLDRVFQDETYAVFKEELIALAEGQTTFVTEIVNQTLQGEKMNVSLRLSLPPGYEETWSQVYVSIIEITERVQSEQALRESEERLSKFINSADNSYHVLDADLNILEINQGALEAIYQGIPTIKSKEDVVGENFELFYPFLKDEFPHFSEVIKTGVKYEHEVTVPHPTLGDLCVSFVCFKVGDGLGVIAENITERKQAEAALYASEQNIRATLDSIGDGVIATDVQGRIERMNPIAEILTGWKLKDAQGKPLDEVFPIISEKTRQTVESPVTQVIQEGIIVGLANDTLLIGKDGAEIPIADSAAPIFNTQDELTGVVLVFRDRTEARQAEAALEELRRQNELILEAAGEGIYGLDLDGNTTFVNPAAAEFIGWEPEELIGKSQHQVLHHTKPDGSPYPREECPIYAAFRDGAVRHVDSEVFWRKDGSSFPVEYISAPIRNPQGGIEGAVVTFKDITERKETESALRESEERLRRFMASATESIFLFDSELNYLMVNERGMKFFSPETTEDEMIGKNILDIVPDLVETGRYDEYKKVIETGIPFSSDDVIPSSPFGDMFLNINAFKVGEGLGMITQDVTERKQAETLVRTQRDLGLALSAASGIEETMQLCVEAILSLPGLDYCGIYLVDQVSGDFNLAHARGAAPEVIEELSHLEADSPRARLIMAGKPVYSQLKDLDLPVEGPIRNLKDYAGAIIPVQHKDQVIASLNAASGVFEEIPLPIRATLETIASQIGDIITIVQAEDELSQHRQQLEVLVEERTQELQVAQESLVRQERLAMLGELAGSVSHELRNPLGVISNAAYYLQTVLADLDENVKEYLEIISTETRGASKIISDLLGFSRSQIADRKEVTPTELVAATLLKHPAPAGIEVTSEIATDLPTVYVDPSQIGQVLSNLVANAYQAMPEGGDLTLRAQVERETLSLTIADTGVGISEENMSKLFEPLFTTKARGIGLGLAISKKLVEANEGSIEVESEVGVGTTFTLLLPIAEK